MIHRSTGSSTLKMLIAVVVIAALGFFGYQYLQKQNVDPASAVSGAASSATGAAGDAVGAAGDAAASAIEAASGEVTAITDRLTGFVDGASSALNDVTDAETAKAAVPKLEAIGNRLSGMGGMVEKIPEVAREPISATIAGSLEKLQPVVDRVMGMPGVGPILQPALDTIVNSLKSLGG